MKVLRVFKKVLLICLLLVIAISFSACSSVRSMTVENTDGTIDELVYVSLNREEIETKGYSETQIIEMKKDIAETAEEKANQLIFNYRIRLKVSPFSNVGVKVIKSSWNKDSYAIGLRFENMASYQLFYNIDPNAPNDATKTKEFLYTKHEYIRYTKYYVYQSLFKELETYFNTQYPELVTSESNETLYTYTTSTKRLHSDADIVTKQDGKYYHTWKIDGENLDETISLYYKIANRGNWIILSIIVTLLFTVILLVVALIIKIISKKIYFNKHNELE